MQDVYEDVSFELDKMDISENYHAPPETEDDIYANTEDCRPKLKKCTDISEHTELKDKRKTREIFISAFGLILMLGTTLCAVGILYYNKEVSYEILSEKYANVTAKLKVQENKSKELKVEHLQVQDDLGACNVSYEILSEKYANVTATLKMQENRTNETKKMHEELKVEHLQVQEDLRACNEIKKLNEAVTVERKQVHEYLIACSANQNCASCKEGWKSLGLKCYFFSTDELNWAQSRDYCVKRGGHLVIITSQAEQVFVVLQIRETHWIGLNDLKTEGQWMWVNNQPLKETGVTFWYSTPGRIDEPDNWKEEDTSGENCAALGHENGDTEKWFDASCRKLKRFICEK